MRQAAKPFRLSPTDAERYTGLRLLMLESEPWAFGASPDDDRGLDVEHLTEMLAKDEYAIFGLEAPDVRDELGEGSASGLVATAGIIRATRPKHAHRAAIWGVYVAPAFRCQGFGRAVMTAAIDLARSWSGVDWIDLGVSENSPEARQLYARLGFEEWGREPEATQVDGRRYDEIHMSLRL